METTLNIPFDVSKRIIRAARVSGISHSELAVILIKKMMNNISNPGRLGKPVQYQERRRPWEWRMFHVRMGVDDYEFCLDLRKLLKMSVSMILALAVKKYLAVFLKNKGTDNYQFKNYIIAGEIIDGIICWKLIWGLPLKIEKFINFAATHPAISG
jgi:hypothetical protein